MQKFRAGKITGVWDETGIWRLCGTYVCRFSGSGRHDPQFVREWEKGTKIVIGVKSASKERHGMYLVRECYYRLINKITDIDHIDQFTGFGLYDRKFVDVVRDLHDPMPYLRGIIAELGFDYKAIEYTQPKRRAGKSKNNFYSLYDYAMIGITSYSKVVMRLATFAGFIIGDSAW